MGFCYVKVRGLGSRRRIVLVFSGFYCGRANFWGGRELWGGFCFYFMLLEDFLRC